MTPPSQPAAAPCRDRAARGLESDAGAIVAMPPSTATIAATPVAREFSPLRLTSATDIRRSSLAESDSLIAKKGLASQKRRLHRQGTRLPPLSSGWRRRQG